MGEKDGRWEAPGVRVAAACGAARALHAALDGLLLGADLAEGKASCDAVSRAQRLKDLMRGAAQHAQVLPYRRKRGAQVFEALVQELAANGARLAKTGER